MMDKPMTKGQLRELRRNAIMERGLLFKKTLTMDYECEDLGEEEVITLDENGELATDEEPVVLVEEEEDNE